jgi:predicted nucleic acid-binding Zn ribbon protein
MSSLKATARQRLRHALITAWRGVPDAPLGDQPVRSAAELTTQIVARLGIEDRLRLEDVSAAWREIVGDYLARHSCPDSASRGVITVRVLQPAVHHALRMEKARILQRLIARLGARAVKDLRFRHG